jgi:hypothetical protein
MSLWVPYKLINKIFVKRKGDKAIEHALQLKLSLNKDRYE